MPNESSRGGSINGGSILKRAGAVAAITPFAGAPSSGTTFANTVYGSKGSLVIDTTNGVLYINTNTKASPTWTKVGTQS